MAGGKRRQLLTSPHAIQVGGVGGVDLVDYIRIHGENVCW